MESKNYQSENQTDRLSLAPSIEGVTEVEANSEHDAKDYQARVDDMKGMLARLSASGDQDGIGKVWDEYVDAETDPLLKRFSAVLLSAPQLAADNAVLSEYKGYRTQKVHLSQEHLSYEKDVKYRVIENNHFLRDMLEEQRDNFTMKQVANWLSSFSENQMLAEGLVAGAMAEIAVRQAAFEMSNALKVVEYGDVEDDSRGADIKARTADDLSAVSIDAKAGKLLPVGEKTHKDIHLVINVPVGVFDAHGRVDGVGLVGIKNAISYGLNQGGFSLEQQKAS